MEQSPFSLPRVAKVPLGVIHGRFQPVHLGHMEYLLAGKARCEHLVIGVTNPDPRVTHPHIADPNRSESPSNPFSFYERLVMLREAMLEAGVHRRDFEITPFPINEPELLRCYVPAQARYYVTIYDDWGRAKRDLLTALGLQVEVMWERTMAQRLTSGREVRKLMAGEGPWEVLVPKAVSRICESYGLVERLRASRASS